MFISLNKYEWQLSRGLTIINPHFIKLLPKSHIIVPYGNEYQRLYMIDSIQ